MTIHQIAGNPRKVFSVAGRTIYKQGFVTSKIGGAGNCSAAIFAYVSLRVRLFDITILTSDDSGSS